MPPEDIFKTGRRETPPALRFLGRRVYLAAIVALIAISPDPDWRARSDPSRRSLHDRALAPLVARHVYGNAILPDDARPYAAGQARFESGVTHVLRDHTAIMFNEYTDETAARSFGSGGRGRRDGEYAWSQCHGGQGARRSNSG
jgi:hypothetical protein